MPLVFRENVENGAALGVWRLTEDLNFLEIGYPLSMQEKEQYALFNNEKRKKEWLAARILLTELLRKKDLVLYNSNGKPYLNNSPFDISISHSKNFIAVLISKQHKVGVDIEHCTNRVSKVKQKFLTNSEQEWCAGINEQTTIWSAKEAIYKVYETSLNYHDIECEPFSLAEFEGSFTSKINKPNSETTATINYFRFDDDVLCYYLKTPK